VGVGVGVGVGFERFPPNANAGIITQARNIAIVFI
jgi:hypothetical protein